MWCLKDNTYITYQQSTSYTKRDALCKNGEWTSRSLILASTLYDIAGTNNNYELLCGTPSEIGAVTTVNTPGILSAKGCVPGTDTNELNENCIQTMCILKLSGNKQITGAILNVPINQTPKGSGVSYIEALGIKRDGCTNIINIFNNKYELCEGSNATNTIYYNPSLQIVLSSVTPSAIPSASINSIIQPSLQTVFSSDEYTSVFKSTAPSITNALYIYLKNVPNEVNPKPTPCGDCQKVYGTQDYSRLYIAKNSTGEEVKAIMVTDADLIDSTVPSSIIYAVYTNPTPLILENIQQQPAGVYTQGTKTYVSIFDTTFNKGETGASWNDLTGKIRTVGGEQ